jgi:hypothetical protein
VLLQVMLASDLLWHINGREATAAVGYDVTLRQARLQGKIDSTGESHPRTYWTPVRGVQVLPGPLFIEAAFINTPHFCDACSSYSSRQAQHHSLHPALSGMP